MSTSELACTYAALILHDDGIPITEEKLNTLISSAGITVEPYWPSLFAKMLAKTSIEDLLMSAGTAGPAAAPAAGGGASAGGDGGAGGAAGGAGEAKVEEEEEEEEEEMEFDLFD